MVRQILTRSFWSFVALADIFAALALYELSVPKNRSITYIWNVSYDWKMVVLGLACVSIAVATVSVAWAVVHDKRIGAPTTQ